LSGSIARGAVEAAGAVVVAIAVVLLGRNQETRAYAMKIETIRRNRGSERKENGAAGSL
jgi:hypothetical protein